MSRLGDYETAIVARLGAALVGGVPAFKDVRGASGGYRTALRNRMRRERNPAAYVAFVEEDTAPETKPTRLGPYFAVLVQADALRESDDPRQDSAGRLGAFTALDQARLSLDDWEILAGQFCRNLRIRFVDADEHTAVYEILYRITPVTTLLAPDVAPEMTVSLAEGTDDTLVLNWTEPKLSGGYGVPTVYKVYRKRVSDSEFTLLAAVGGDALSVTIESQPKGELLTYYVVASNAGGDAGPGPMTTILI